MLVLHVEDEKARAESVKDYLESRVDNAQVIHFSSAEAALEYLADPQNPKPDIILSDFELMRGGGSKNGAQFAVEVHEKYELPLIMLSGTSWFFIKADTPELQQSAPEIGQAIAALVPKSGYTALPGLITRLASGHSTDPQLKKPSQPGIV